MSTTTLRDEFKSIYLDDSDFSESVTYNVLGTTAKSINAVIFRSDFQKRGQLGDRGANSNPLEYSISIMISKDTTNGIETVTPKVDSIELLANTDDAATQLFRVARVIYQDQAVWQLGLIK
jgi:hypothetical protein